MENYQNLKFAALFKDIGKFYQRAYKDLFDEKSHAKWSANFVKKYYNENIENLIIKSDGSDVNLLNILKKSNYREKENIITNESSDSPLVSIFSKINILNSDNQNINYLPLNKLVLSYDIFPKSEKSELDYKSLWDEFIDEFEKLPNHNDFETVLALIKKYTYAIPSSAYVDEDDISLFDDIKTSVALTNCNYFFNLENQSSDESYTIINGDISGIQNFIYRVSSPKDAQKDMSKRLRGRSLYLTLLSEAITSYIINSLFLDSTNVLFCGGGRFTIIAPNTKQTQKCIDDIDKIINEFFIKEFNAELYLAVESLNISNNDLNNFNKILAELNGKLSENKKHKFYGCLTELFKTTTDVCNVSDLCHVCGNQTDNEYYCDTCNGHVNLGRDVANSKYLIKYIGKELPNSSFYNKYLEIGFIFSKKDISHILNKSTDVKLYVYKLNDTNFLDYDYKDVSFDFKFFGNNVPTIDDNILYFEHLAQCSKGSKKLGVLKMDVDNLGKIFSQGFNKSGNISKSSSLSFNMDLFFSGIINNIVNEFKVYTDCKGKNELFDYVGRITFEENNSSYEIFKPKERLNISDEFEDCAISTIYINYSGGDDLLVVGPYDDIIEFAQMFRDKFKEWTGNNASINISAGIKIIGSKFPIGKAAIMADNDLEKSKDCGRNKITVFNQVLEWHTEGECYPGFDKIFCLAKRLENLRGNGKISAGFVYSLLHMWEHKTDISELKEFNEESWENYNILKYSKKAYIPSLYYKLRIVKDSELKEELKNDLKDMMPWIRVPVSWSSLRLR